MSSWPESPVAHSPPLCCHLLVAVFMVSWCPPWPLITTIITRAQPRRGLWRPLQQCITSMWVFFYHHIIIHIHHSGSVRNNKNSNSSLTSTAVMPGVVIMLSLLYLIDVPNKLNRDFQIETSDYEELPKVWSPHWPSVKTPRFVVLLPPPPIPPLPLPPLLCWGTFVTLVSYGLRKRVFLSSPPHF